MAQQSGYADTPLSEALNSPLPVALLPAGTASAPGVLQLDGTAAHIQPTGPQAAGANGKPADSGHVHFSSGQFLCAPNVYAPGSPTSLTVSSTTLAAWSSGVVCTNPFTAPASGEVVVEVTCAAEAASGGSKLVYGLAAAGTVTPVLGNVITTVMSNGTALLTQAIRFAVTGLAPGTSYQFDLLGAVSASTATIIAYGNTGTTVGSAGAPVIVTVQAV